MVETLSRTRPDIPDPNVFAQTCERVVRGANVGDPGCLRRRCSSELHPRRRLGNDEYGELAAGQLGSGTRLKGELEGGLGDGRDQDVAGDGGLGVETLDASSTRKGAGGRLVDPDDVETVTRSKRFDAGAPVGGRPGGDPGALTQRPGACIPFGRVQPQHTGEIVPGDGRKPVVATGCKYKRVHVEGDEGIAPKHAHDVILIHAQGEIALCPIDDQAAIRGMFGASDNDGLRIPLLEAPNTPTIAPPPRCQPTGGGKAPERAQRQAPDRVRS